jgi:hypothetical protein
MFVRAVEESVKYTLCTVPRVACSDLAPSLDLPLLAVCGEKIEDALGNLLLVKRVRTRRLPTSTPAGETLSHRDVQPQPLLPSAEPSASGETERAAPLDLACHHASI